MDAGEGSVTDLYEVLGLERGQTAAELLQEVQLLRPFWELRCARPGAGEDAREQLAAVQRAEIEFVDEESRRRYDVSLSGFAPECPREPSPDPSPARPSGSTATDPRLAEGLSANHRGLEPDVATHATEGAATAEVQAAVGVMAGVPDLYAALALDRAASTAALSAALRDDLEPGWRARVERPGRTGVKARELLDLVAEARRVFDSEEARASYDATLTDSQDAATVEPVWRAWGHLFQGEAVRALEASHQTREEHPTDPMGHVVAAWAALAQGDARSASEAAEQAYGVGWAGDDLADIHHARGAALLALREYDAAAESLGSAIDRATPPELPEIFLRKALAEEGRGATSAVIATCVRGLALDPAPSAGVRDRLEQAAQRAFRAKCHRDDDPRGSAQAYAETRDGWRSSLVPEPSKSVVLAFFDREIDAERSRAEQEEPRTPPPFSGEYPGALVGMSGPAPTPYVPSAPAPLATPPFPVAAPSGAALDSAVPAPVAASGLAVASAPFGLDPLTGLPYSEKSKVVAGLLQIFGGTLGLGRFYLGNPGMAIAQILGTWLTLGIGALWPLIDGIMLLVGHPRDKYGRPLRS